MLTTLPPIVKEVGVTGENDVYLTPGDVTGYRNICREFIAVQCPDALEMRRLESMEIEAPVWTRIGVSDV